ncbi:MAG: right-handed parallel beta-helix repeat-containing protein, partial [Deltaproteobacteria bacterium]|nr:right-handed parallel beta-helix repeat-containing protein [Deltaproteobacteria bacterium]
SSLQAGDTITFNDGTYVLEGSLYWTGTGTEGAPIIFEPAEGATPVLQRMDGGWAVVLTDSSWVEIRGLTFEGGGLVLSGELNTHITVEDCILHALTGNGIRIQSNAQFLLIQHNHVYDIEDSSGIYAGCNDTSCWMQDSVIAGNQVHGIGGTYNVGIYLANGSHSNVVRDNVIFNVPYIGLRLGSTEFSPPNVADGNAVWGVTGDAMLVDGAARVHNNLLFGVEGYGLRASSNNREAFENVAVTFNTIVNTLNYGIRLDGWADRRDMVLANNVVANPTGAALEYRWGDATDTDNHIVGNVFTGYVGVDPTLFPDWYVAGAGTYDFVDVEGFDFYPSTSSTLVDAADDSEASLVPEVDFNGLVRPLGPPDVGAYEWRGFVNPGWPVGRGFKDPPLVAPLDEGSGGCDCLEGGEGSAAVLFVPFWLGWLGRRQKRVPLAIAERREQEQLR